MLYQRSRKTFCEFSTTESTSTSDSADRGCVCDLPYPSSCSHQREENETYSLGHPVLYAACFAFICCSRALAILNDLPHVEQETLPDRAFAAATLEAAAAAAGLLLRSDALRFFPRSSGSKVSGKRTCLVPAWLWSVEDSLRGVVPRLLVPSAADEDSPVFASPADDAPSLRFFCSALRVDV